MTLDHNPLSHEESVRLSPKRPGPLRRMFNAMGASLHEVACNHLYGGRYDGHETRLKMLIYNSRAEYANNADACSAQLQVIQNTSGRRLLQYYGDLLDKACAAPQGSLLENLALKRAGGVSERAGRDFVFPLLDRASQVLNAFMEIGHDTGDAPYTFFEDEMRWLCTAHFQTRADFLEHIMREIAEIDGDTPLLRQALGWVEEAMDGAFNSAQKPDDPASRAYYTDQYERLGALASEMWRLEIIRLSPFTALIRPHIFRHAPPHIREAAQKIEHLATFERDS